MVLKLVDEHFNATAIRAAAVAAKGLARVTDDSVKHFARLKSFSLKLYGEEN